MATLDDLHIPSITEMSFDEAIEYLRQIRLSRRTMKPTKETTIKKIKEKASIPKLSAGQAADLLRILEGSE